MGPEEVEQRLLAGEDARTEFKSVVRTGFLLDASDAAKEICAFANTGGGDLFVGIEDDGSVTGVGDAQAADRLDRHLAQVARDGIHPPILCTRLKVVVRGMLVLIVRVPGFRPDRPFRARHTHYVRDGSTSREARRDELVRLISSAAHEHFDESTARGATRDDLDSLAIRAFCHVAYPGVPEAAFERYLLAIQAVEPTGDPTVTGILLFGLEPQRFLLDAYVTAVRFPGVVLTGEFADRREIRGRVGDQFDETIAFLQRHVPAPSHVEGLVRREEGLPLQVLREAVQNALVHRDYQMASQTRVFVFDDRVEIRNPGELLNRLTLDGVRLGGISQRRNPHLAAALSRFNRRENAGTGVPEMIHWMRERGLPEPEFSVTDGEFRVVLKTAARPAG